MPRILNSAFRQAIEASASSELLLCFATITHPQLAMPIYTVCDVVDYIYNGNRFYGVPFDFTLLTDNDKPPVCTIRIQNVDQIIGNAVLALNTVWPRLLLQVMAGSDWGPVFTDGPTQRRTRSPLGTPTVEYQANHLRINKVTCDAISVQGDITSIDLTREPWPSTRATKDRLPGLYI
jgi:hypothetical protein